MTTAVVRCGPAYQILARCQEPPRVGPLRSSVVPSASASRAIFSNTPRRTVTSLRKTCVAPVQAAKDDNPAFGGWMDATKIVSGGGSGDSDPLADKIGSEIYADINGWHLYVRDLKLASTLSKSVKASIADGERIDDAVTDALKSVPIKLGQKSEVPLLDLITSFVFDDMVKIVEDYQDDKW